MAREEQKLCIIGLLAKPIQIWPQGTKLGVKSFNKSIIDFKDPIFSVVQIKFEL